MLYTHTTRYYKQAVVHPLQGGSMLEHPNILWSSFFIVTLHSVTAHSIQDAALTNKNMFFAFIYSYMLLSLPKWQFVCNILFFAKSALRDNWQTWPTGWRALSVLTKWHTITQHQVFHLSAIWIQMAGNAEPAYPCEDSGRWCEINKYAPMTQTKING